VRRWWGEFAGTPPTETGVVVEVGVLVVGDQLFKVNIVVGVVVVGIVGLIIAGVVPCIHHLRMFGEGRYTCVRIEVYPETICCNFYLSLFKG
jgi:hypothetical protein